jgi:peptide/nickel transport system permease protein
VDHEGCVTVVRAGSSALHVSLGKSFQLRRPVIEVLAERVPRTFALALAAVLLQIGLGAASGTVAALRRGSWVDRLVVGTSLLGVSAPTFLIALFLQYVFSRRLRWLPLDGFGTTPGEHLLSLVLPALTLGLYGAAFYTRLVRDELIVALGQDWVRTARAKGLAPWRVVARHGLRNAAIPVVTALALDFGSLMGGAIVTETVFRWPGIGALSVRGMLDRDGPVVCGCVVVTAIAVVAANLAADLAYVWLDPRVTDPRERDTR